MSPAEPPDGTQPTPHLSVVVPAYNEETRLKTSMPVILGYLGVKPTTVWGQFGFDAFFLDTKDRATWVARLCTVLYFAFFVLMPWYTARDKTRPVPVRTT